MKFTFFTILVLLTSSISAQKNKFGARLEITPSFTTTSSPNHFYLREPAHFYLSENIFATGSYGIGEHMDVTTGVGFLSTKQFQIFTPGFEVNVFRTENFITHQYVVIPAGLNFHFGSFFIHPEVGAAFGVGHPTIRTNYETRALPDGSILTIASGIEFNSPNSSFYHQVTVPLMLSMGGDVNVGFCKVLFGAKGYYSLNDIDTINKGKYFGFGAMTGVKF